MRKRVGRSKGNFTFEIEVCDGQIWIPDPKTPKKEGFL